MIKFSKIQRGYYPISYSDINKYIKVCRKWDYGNKDTCKYCAEQIIEKLQLIHPSLIIKDSLYNELVEIIHDLNNGKLYKNKHLLISIN